MKKIKTAMTVAVFVAAAGFVSTAYAHGGWGGARRGHMMGHGYGMGPGMMGYGGCGMGPGMMGYGYGRGYGSCHQGDLPEDLSKEDRQKLQQLQDEFFDETRALREQIRDKQFALNEELDSAKPDKAKVVQLQKAISKLQSDYAQKAVEYRLEVRKILPQGAGDFGRKMGPGTGGCPW